MGLDPTWHSQRQTQNSPKQESRSAYEDDDDDNEKDDEEMQEDSGKIYDTSERDGRYARIRTDPEFDVTQINMDREISRVSGWENY